LGNGVPNILYKYAIFLIIDGFCNDDDDFSNSNDDGLKEVYTISNICIASLAY